MGVYRGFSVNLGGGFLVKGKERVSEWFFFFVTYMYCTYSMYVHIRTVRRRVHVSYSTCTI